MKHAGCRCGGCEMRWYKRAFIDACVIAIRVGKFPVRQIAWESGRGRR